MLGAIIMFVIGFRAKRFRWWHAPVLLWLAYTAAMLLETRLKRDGYIANQGWVLEMTLRQAAIDGVTYLAGIWLGIGLAARKAMKGRSTQEEELSPPEA